MNKQFGIVVTIIIMAAAFAGVAYMHQRSVAEEISARSSIATLVGQFGASMQKVSLSAPDALDEIATTYSPYATPSLIQKWQANRSFAPGRGLSSPWPDRIEVGSTTKQDANTYMVNGTVIEITSNEVTHGGIAAEFPVTLTIKHVQGQWLIDNYVAGPVKEFANSTTTAATSTPTH